MAADPRKRQKKLAKRSAKRKAKHHEMARTKSAGLPERMAAAAAYPIVDCLATTDLAGEGMGWVLLSRELPDGGVALAIFLIDRYCLGVKDAIARIVSRYEYSNEILHKMRQECQLRQSRRPPCAVLSRARSTTRAASASRRTATTSGPG